MSSFELNRIGSDIKPFKLNKKVEEQATTPKGFELDKASKPLMRSLSKIVAVFEHSLKDLNSNKSNLTECQLNILNHSEFKVFESLAKKEGLPAKEFIDELCSKYKELGSEEFKKEFNIENIAGIAVGDLIGLRNLTSEEKSFINELTQAYKEQQNKLTQESNQNKFSTQSNQEILGKRHDEKKIDESSGNLDKNYALATKLINEISENKRNNQILENKRASEIDLRKTELAIREHLNINFS